MSALVSDTPHTQYSEEGNENEVNFMLTPDVRPEIKNEPPEDIDDTPGPTMGDHQLMNGKSVSPSKRPNITLTPTMKLMATPNAVDPKRKFPCPYDNCTKSYGKSSHLRSHLTWHTGIKPYECREPNCGKSFTRSDELNRHSRTHTGEKPFECMQCAKKFSRSDHLTKHVATHTKQMQSQKRVRSVGNTDQKPPSPSIAPPTPKKPALTELTEMSVPQHGINYNDGMHFMASLLECTQFKHGRHVLEPENLTEETSFVPQPIRIKLERPENSEEYKVVNRTAESSSEEVKDEFEASDHKTEEKVATAGHGLTLQDASTNDPLATTEQNSSPVDGAMKALTVVNAALNDDDNGLEDDGDDDDDTNDDAIMPEANAPPLPLAGAPYAVPHFGFHEEDIDPERPYRCKECVKCFKRQDDLNRHLRTHTGEKPYACTNCSKRFMRSDHLKKHLKTHSKQR